MNKPLITFVIAISVTIGICPPEASAKWRKPVPATETVAKRTKAPVPTRAVSDTVCPDSGMIVAAGFEKVLRSSRESVFITNNTSRPLEALKLDITYKDMRGRMLHRNAMWVEAEIPAGETRMVSFPSFDRQNLFYYHLSPLPSRASRATPFTVGIEVALITHPVSSDQ